ncbi:MAG: hypothetical protein AMXMBFR6_08420 [Betaproteobacteria bacterium]
MSGPLHGPYTLVDPPVTPYSSLAEIRAWLDTCRTRAAAQPDDEGWRAAVESAMHMLASAEGDASRSAH